MKYFVVVAASPTELQNNVITSVFNGKPQYGFWHWVQNFWLVHSTNDADTSATLRDAIKLAVPGLSFMVFAIAPVPGDWSGFSDLKWAEWLQRNWPQF